MRVLLWSFVALFTAAPAVAQGPAPAPAAAAVTPPLPDAELARQTGKFLLPNGVELALSVTSDTTLNGQPVLRTVFTIDHGVQTQVFGRDPAAAPVTYAPTGNAAAGGPTGVTVTMDRQSGLQTVTPTYGVAAGAPGVSVGAAQDPRALGLTALPVTDPDAFMAAIFKERDFGRAMPFAVATPDGAVTVTTLPSGTQVTLAGDHFAVSDLVGHAIATAIANSGNDRTFDTATNVAIDLRNIAPYQVGAAQMRVESLALDAARGLGR